MEASRLRGHGTEEKSPCSNQFFWIQGGKTLDTQRGCQCGNPDQLERPCSGIWFFQGWELSGGTRAELKCHRSPFSDHFSEIPIFITHMEKATLQNFLQVSLQPFLWWIPSHTQGIVLRGPQCYGGGKMLATLWPQLLLPLARIRTYYTYYDGYLIMSPSPESWIMSTPPGGIQWNDSLPPNLSAYEEGAKLQFPGLFEGCHVFKKQTLGVTLKARYIFRCTLKCGWCFGGWGAVCNQAPTCHPICVGRKCLCPGWTVDH